MYVYTYICVKHIGQWMALGFHNA